MNAKRSLRLLSLVLLGLLLCGPVSAATVADYCILPPFIASSVPPLVMFETGRDHKLFYTAYNDSADLDDDGKLDIDYKHSIDYYGYFDPYKCYQYDTSGTDMFVPVSRSATKFCSTSGGQWSGNVLNWLSMSRIDVLKKVLYGGHRVSDSNALTVLERATVPQDAHSWGKEFTGRLCYNATGTPQYTYSCSLDTDCASGYTCTDKSSELVGFNAAGVSTCTATLTTFSNNTMLVARYLHPAGLNAAQTTGDTHTDLLSSFASTAEPLTTTFIDYDTGVTDFGTTGTKLDPTQNHLDNYSAMVVADFKTSNGSGNETWEFMVDSDDGADVEILTTGGTSLGVVASHYGAHANCATAPATMCAGMVKGSLSLAKSRTWYRLVVRLAEGNGSDGVRVWYNKAGAGWKLFGTANLGDKNMRAFEATAAKQCTLYSSEFINKGIPTSGTTSSDTSKRHLVCNTTLSDNGAPLMRLLKDVTGKRIWDWAAKERPVCDTSLGTPADYEVRVKVCDSSIDTADEMDITKNEIGDSCKRYPPTTGTTWKPIGLMQQYGEGDGTKVCSKTMFKSCNSDAGCTFATEGKCIDKADMYFGMFSTSYEKNLSGGVLRKNIGAILDESNANNGIFQSSENTQGNIILTYDRLKIVGFRNSDQSYQDNTGGSCGWITDRPLNQGECRSWGNPIAEMLYESLRYYAGKLTPTPAFTYTGTQDSGLQLSKPDWGYKDGSVSKPLYDVFPACSRPFILLLSDVNPSYDSDQIPGNEFASVTEDAEAPQLGLGVIQSSGRSLLNDLTYTIGATEGIHSNSWYSGENGTDSDFLCSGKSASKLSLLRGMCPEEPTKKGSFYTAAVAYYGRTQFADKTGKPDVNTFVVALSSPFSEFTIKTPNGIITMLPTAKSVSGCLGTYGACAARMNLAADTTYGIKVLPKSPADAAAYCPTNTIVNYYVDDIRYDTSNNVTYALFRINYEDVEQGADHDMDAIVKYELCTATAATNGYGSCGTSSLTADQVEIKLVSDYAAGCIDQVMGFVISGTTEDGVYLPIKDKDVGGSDGDTPAVVADLPLTWSKEFTVGATTSAKTLKSPLWYAAKWGGFNDANSNKIPDLKSEWAAQCTQSDVTLCNPDNYYPVVNPLKLRRQLNKALNDIMARTASGTAASILSNSEGSGANILQAVFFPKKLYGEQEVNWIGEIHNLWYYIDPFISGSQIKEDSNSDGELSKTLDKRIAFMMFNNKASFVRVPNDGPFEPDDPLNGLKTLWSAGKKLWERNLSSDARVIYTNLTGSLTSFTALNTSTTKVQSYLQAANQSEADKIINFINGVDDATLRSRVATINGVDHVWKMGDIISSTPRIQSVFPLQTYHRERKVGYEDTTYQAFISTTNYTNRGMVYAGTNDGLFHAFKLGKLVNSGSEVTGDRIALLKGNDLGREEWAFIPRNVLPYLKYLTDPAYKDSHIYLNDLTPQIFDASIGTAALCASTSDPILAARCGTTTNYWDRPKDFASWRTFVIGGMGIGGATRKMGTATCTDGLATGTCVKTPITDPEDASASTGLGFSSYFALDITNMYYEAGASTGSTTLNGRTPSLLWEFDHPELGFATTGPGIVRLNSRTVIDSSLTKRRDTQTGIDMQSNGRWLAVFASGPTGPVDKNTKQFLGKSDQNLKLFVFDMVQGPTINTKNDNVWVIDTGIPFAFAGSMSGSVEDVERKTLRDGSYQDDVLYVGYVKKGSSGKWDDGGILRVVIPHIMSADDFNPTVAYSSTDSKLRWRVGRLIDGIGPVTSGLSRIKSFDSPLMMVLFGTGRYFYRDDDPYDAAKADSDPTKLRKLFAVKDPCYAINVTHDGYDNAGAAKTWLMSSPDMQDQENSACYTATSNSPDVSVAFGDLDNRTTVPPAANQAPHSWYINLDQNERSLTVPVATDRGDAYFTTYTPSQNICEFTGRSFFWGVNALTGGELPFSVKQGKALIQTSVGVFVEIDLETAFTDKGGRRTSATAGAQGEMIGKAATDAPSIITKSGLKAKKKILHIMER